MICNRWLEIFMAVNLRFETKKIWELEEVELR